MRSMALGGCIEKGAEIGSLFWGFFTFSCSFLRLCFGLLLPFALVSWLCWDAGTKGASMIWGSIEDGMSSSLATPGFLSYSLFSM